MKLQEEANIESNKINKAAIHEIYGDPSIKIEDYYKKGLELSISTVCCIDEKLQHRIIIKFYESDFKEGLYLQIVAFFKEKIENYNQHAKCFFELRDFNNMISAFKDIPLKMVHYSQCRGKNFNLLRDKDIYKFICLLTQNKIYAITYDEITMCLYANLMTENFDKTEFKISKNAQYMLKNLILNETNLIFKPITNLYDKRSESSAAYANLNNTKLELAAEDKRPLILDPKLSAEDEKQLILDPKLSTNLPANKDKPTKETPDESFFYKYKSKIIILSIGLILIFIYAIYYSKRNQPRN